MRAVSDGWLQQHGYLRTVRPSANYGESPARTIEVGWAAEGWHAGTRGMRVIEAANQKSGVFACA